MRLLVDAGPLAAGLVVQLGTAIFNGSRAAEQLRSAWLRTGNLPRLN
ncbi:hypothetical protein [Arthrobacter sp. PAMC25564]|nr:hypothetical protein [Arthrobacter sp. PAMC25564]